jgi:hypothetical protein
VYYLRHLWRAQRTSSERRFTGNIAVQPTDKLTFRYIAAYLVEGLQCPTDGTLLLYSSDERGQRVLLTGHSYDGLDHIDTAHAIGNMLLKSIFQGGIWDLRALASHVSETNQERLRLYGTDTAFLVVEASYEEEAASIGQIGQWEEIDCCLALPNEYKQKVREKYKDFVSRAQGFLTLAISGVIGLKAIVDVIVADHPSGKPLYVSSISVSADLTVLKSIPVDSLEGLSAFFSDAAKVLSFDTAIRRSGDSTLNRKDNLRAFLFAITAMDSFLTNFFSENRQCLVRHRKDHLSRTEFVHGRID